MYQLPLEQWLLVWIQIAALFMLCAKLWRSGLRKIYPFFFSYLALEFLQTLIPLFLPVNGKLYMDGYVVSQGLIVCSYIFVILELYSVVLRNLAGIANLSRRSIKIFLVVATLPSLLLLRIEKMPDKLTGYLFIFERPIMSSLLLFVVLIAAFLVYYPVPIGRNVVIYLTGYGAYFIAESASILFLNNLGRVYNRWLSDATMGISVICLLFWLFGLNAGGEEKSVVVGYRWNPADEQRLLRQLEAINASLLRSRETLNTPEKDRSNANRTETMEQKAR